MDDSSITYDEIKESYDEDADAEDKSNNEANLYNEAKTIPTNSNEKKKNCKTQNFYILLAFLLITTALLISVSIYCYLIKCEAKQKHLLPFQFISNKLK